MLLKGGIYVMLGCIGMEAPSKEVADLRRYHHKWTKNKNK